MERKGYVLRKVKLSKEKALGLFVEIFRCWKCKADFIEKMIDIRLFF